MNHLITSTLIILLLRSHDEREPDYEIPRPGRRVWVNPYNFFGHSQVVPDTGDGESTRISDGNYDGLPALSPGSAAKHMRIGGKYVEVIDDHFNVPAVSPGAVRGGVGVLRGVYTHTNTLQEYADSDAEFYQVFTIDNDRDLISMKQPHRHIELTRLKQRPQTITYETERSRRGRTRRLELGRYFDEQSTKENLDEGCCLFRIAYPIDIFVQKDER